MLTMNFKSFDRFYRLGQIALSTITCGALAVELIVSVAQLLVRTGFRMCVFYNRGKLMKAIQFCLALLLPSICTCNTLGAATMYLASNEHFGGGTVYAIDIVSRTATLLGPAGITFEYGGLGFAQDGTLYGWESGSNALYTVNTTSGQWNLIGGTSPTRGETFDINPLTNEAIVTDLASEQLYTVTLATGASALRVGLTNFQPGAASAFGPDGTLYYIDVFNGSIRSVDIDTGVVSLVGLTGLPGADVTNLSYNPEDDMLYSVETLGNSLYRFDPSNGTGVNLGAIADLPVTGGQYTMGTIRIVIPEPATSILALLGVAGAVSYTRRTLR